MNVNRYLFIVVLILLSLSSISCSTEKQYNKFAQTASNPVARFETNMGIFTVELFKDKVPNTVHNFILLANKGFFNNTVFHRVIPNFMIQGGDPTGTGRGGPGYTIKDEFNKELKHDKPGVISMANAGPNTAGSQFFIIVKPTPWLDGKHAIFGQVTEGIDIVHKISEVQRNSEDRPHNTVILMNVKIQDK